MKFGLSYLILALLASPALPQEFMDEVEAIRKVDEHLQHLFNTIRMGDKGTIATDEYVVGDGDAHAKRFRSISEELAGIEAQYVDCLGALSDKNFSEETIDDCVGTEFVRVHNTITFFKNKVYAKVDRHIRAVFIELCYDAATDEIMLRGCDLFEKDTLDVLWAEMNIAKVADINRQKYLSTMATLPEETFNTILLRFAPLYEEFSELVQEIRDHHLSIVEGIKTSIDERTRMLLLRAKASGGYTPLPKMYNHRVEVVQTLAAGPVANVHQMPSILMDGSTKLYADQYDEQGHKQNYTPDNYEDLQNGPTVVIPIRKLEKRMEALRAKLKARKRRFV